MIPGNVLGFGLGSLLPKFFFTSSRTGFNPQPKRGFIDPEELAVECITQLNSISAKRMSADRIFFSGGEPSIHLPYIQKVVETARGINPHTKVNFDTNGYMTMDSLKKVLALSTSITYELKAYRDEVHLALTGVSSGPVLRNAAPIAKYAKEKLWEYRVVVIPKINELEVKPLVEFIADIDASLRVCFLAFRPNSPWKIMLGRVVTSWTHVWISLDHPSSAMLTGPGTPGSREKSSRRIPQFRDYMNPTRPDGRPHMHTVPVVGPRQGTVRPVLTIRRAISGSIPPVWSPNSN